MSEQHADVGVATLADRSEPADVAARSLAWSQSEIAREATARGESIDLSHKGDERRSGQKADSREQNNDRVSDALRPSNHI